DWSSDVCSSDLCLPYQALLSDGRLICGSSIIPHSGWFAIPSLRISRRHLSSIVSSAVSLRLTRTLYVVLPLCRVRVTAFLSTIEPLFLLLSEHLMYAV